MRKQIENYIFDFEILQKAYDLPSEVYEAIIPNILGEVKSKATELTRVCGIKTGISKTNFIKQLAMRVMPGMEVYRELKGVIFINP